MANANTPRGLIPRQHMDGSAWNGKANVYYVPSTYATALYLGLPLVATGASDANGVPVVQVATAGGGAYTIGPMVGIDQGEGSPIAITRDMPLYHPASTSQYIRVADDPDLIFEIQEDSVGGSIAMATAGTKNADFIAGAGSATTGFSGWMLDSSTINTTNTLQLRLLKGVPGVDNTMAAAYAKWLVKINLHSLRNLTGI
jgi:hypothetical protein